MGRGSRLGEMLPYVDGVAHDGPLFVASGALIAAFNEFSYLPMRVAGWAACCALSRARQRRPCSSAAVMLTARLGAGVGDYSMAGAMSTV